MDFTDLLTLTTIAGIWLTTFALDLYHRRMIESLLAGCVLSALYWTFTATRYGVPSLAGVLVWLAGFIIFHWRAQRELVPLEVIEAREVGPRVFAILLLLYVSAWCVELLASLSPSTYAVVTVPFALGLVGLGLVAAGRFGYGVTCLVISLVAAPVALVILTLMGW